MENGNGSLAPALSPETWLILFRDTQRLWGQLAVREGRLPGPISHYLGKCLDCLTDNYVTGYRVHFCGLLEHQPLVLEQLCPIEHSVVTKMFYEPALSSTVATNPR